MPYPTSVSPNARSLVLFAVQLKSHHMLTYKTQFSMPLHKRENVQ